MEQAKRSSRINLVLCTWLLITLTLLQLMQVSGMSTEEAVPLLVIRRQQGPDILILTNSTHHRNCYAHTYLVNERQCVDNQVLHDACRFAISSHQDPSNSSYQITLFINDQGQLQSTVVVVTYDPHGQCCSRPVNNTLCHISSLEVYRGSEQAIEINHDGFSLTDNGTININQSSLAYPIVEFVGELYRMNLSCSGGALPESGCLFFKVGGATNLTKAKFDDRVPGTIQTLENHITTTTAVSSAIQPTTAHEVFSHPKSSVSSTILTTHSSTSSSRATVTTDLMIYIIIAAAGGVAALLFVVILLCIVLVYCARTNKTNTATSNDNKDITDQGQLELSNEANVPPLRNLWCEQSDMLSVIPINSPMRQTIPVPTDNNPVYAEVDFIEEESPIPPTDYHNNPAYMHFMRI